MIRRPPRSTQSRSSAASDVYKRQHQNHLLKQLVTLRDQNEPPKWMPEEASSNNHVQEIDHKLRVALQAVSKQLISSPSNAPESLPQPSDVLDARIAHADKVCRDAERPLPIPDSDLPSTAADAVRMRHGITRHTPQYRIPLAAISAEPLVKPELSPPRRQANLPPRMPRPEQTESNYQWKDTANNTANDLITGEIFAEDGATLPGSPYWTQCMNIADMPDGETSVYKDAEMKRMLKAWLMPRRTTKWCSGGCTLEQKVEQKRSRMGSGGRTPLFMMHCG
eukprot:TRINITY_DN277_c0_g1_i2.p1 TRINITY_DN277_c0_g1~~TRINITY_DN277_c0_g1_i2.p1  ORF type:complete len:280 (-),score=34.36 TRINITY_DN277_c0_g1_i2:339-1178(-)